MKRRSAARIGVNSRDLDHRGDVGDNRLLITDPTQGLLSRGSLVRIRPGAPTPSKTPLTDIGTVVDQKRWSIAFLSPHRARPSAPENIFSLVDLSRHAPLTRENSGAACTLQNSEQRAL